MDICSTSGEIQRMVIPKSQGKVAYRDARKAMWGDLFPHPSKNKVVTRVSKGVTEATTTAETTTTNETTAKNA